MKNKKIEKKDSKFSKIKDKAYDLYNSVKPSYDMVSSVSNTITFCENINKIPNQNLEDYACGTPKDLLLNQIFNPSSSPIESISKGQGPLLGSLFASFFEGVSAILSNFGNIKN